MISPAAGVMAAFSATTDAGSADAMEHVAGYTCFNDASVRDWQFHTHQYGMGRTFRKTGAFGPWLVPAADIPDCRKLVVRGLLNGEQLQEGRLSELAFDIPHLIAYVSKALAWNPGDILATRTPSGIGFKRNPPIFLKPGDVFEVVITEIGTLSQYSEAIAPFVARYALLTGRWLASTREGRIGLVSREDCVASAVAMKTRYTT